MAERIKVIQNKQARGHILYLLEITHPTPTPINALSQAMIENGINTSPDISEHLDYLEGKGYIRVTSIGKPNSPLGVTVAKLLPKGIDLLEETITDPGVDCDG